MSTYQKNRIILKSIYPIDCLKWSCGLKVILFFVFFFIFQVKVTYAQYDVVILNNENEIDNFKAKDSSEVYSKLNIIINKFSKRGYLSVSVDSVLFNKNEVTAFLFFGQQYFWKKVEYSYPENFKIKLKKFDGKIVNTKKLEDEIERIINYFENTGYPFVEVKADSFSIKQNYVFSRLKVYPNNYIVYDSVFFSPDIKISVKFLQKYLNFNKGNEYNEKEIKLIDSKLSALPFLETIHPAELEFHDKNVDLYLYLKNKKINQISGIVGFSNANDKFQLTGQTDFSFVNTFKNADIINFKWQKTKQQTQNLSFDLEIPYIFSTSLGVSNNLFIEKIDTSYVDVLNNVSFSYFFSGYNKVSSFVNTQRSIVFDTNTTYRDFSAILYGIGINFKQLDNYFNPSKGYFADFSIGAGQKNIADSTTVQMETKVNLGLFIPLFPKIVFHNRLFFYWLNDEYILENQLYKFGGTELQRGFDERSLSANKIYFGAVEIRYLFDKKSNVLLFADNSILQHFSEDNIFWNHPFGIGVGLNFATQNSIFSLTYAIGKDDFSPFLFKNAKVHFGVKTIF